ncbi:MULTISPECIES: tRNA lysidine(34) synthetase TilS [Asticcacaulis]|uniref:tRNA lysidine(34) synthetase TilS n=1 Tax=Asticcacaulis TaxID=76890 RepID=UPI001AE2FC70|nr:MULTISPECIES: tRNA lysidine(34) synthetase TilS [Asticcacaulis]MBP2159429.1 tRNA(Ile)-lysidine synthase [Asticcacaulis solisilvae]MDR6800744.1 tRNA(Ile)-lysidine synthase [Asticcacaulis sp. BE141]
MQGLTASLDDAFAIFETYLDGPADHPVGVAVSGGGDSVALLHALALWGRRPLEVFSVDHGLNPDSRRWIEGVARHAQSVGAGFTALEWTGEKPRTGLSAKARMARHRLLADAARAKGVTVICLAHTHDDIAEALVMAEEGSNVGPPALWAPSPVWPEGRGVFLFRPFIGKRRAELRDFLKLRGVSWIEDPANENMASARARARKALEGQVLVSPTLGLFLQPVRLCQDLPHLLVDDGFGDLGAITFDAEVFDALPDAVARHRLAAAVVSAGGGDRLPRRDSLDRLRRDLTPEATATLGGARVHRGGGRITMIREAGELERCRADPVCVEAGHPVMWDGRFEILTGREATVQPSAQVRPSLTDVDRNALLALPAALRGALPAVSDGGTSPVLPIPLHTDDTAASGIKLACWVMPRFLAACGVFACESDCSRMREKPL